MDEPAGPPPDLRGLVLAGGRSERLGRDKAAVVIDGCPLLELAVVLLRRFVSDVRVAVRPDQLSDDLRGRFALIPDEAAGIGPAAGIIAAHRLVPGSAWLVLACDMPLVDEQVLATLVGGRDATRPATAFKGEADGLPEPLCAIYEPATLARFRRQLEAGGNPSPRDWLAAANPRLLETPGLNALGSINTPEDLEALVGATRGGRARPVSGGEKGSH
jgi:molybdenum cofactor guanylyltransferase